MQRRIRKSEKEKELPNEFKSLKHRKNTPKWNSFFEFEVSWSSLSKPFNVSLQFVYVSVSYWFCSDALIYKLPYATMITHIILFLILQYHIFFHWYQSLPICISLICWIFFTRNLRLASQLICRDSERDMHAWDWNSVNVKCGTCFNFAFNFRHRVMIYQTICQALHRLWVGFRI